MFCVLFFQLEMIWTLVTLIFRWVTNPLDKFYFLYTNLFMDFCNICISVFFQKLNMGGGNFDGDAAYDDEVRY